MTARIPTILAAAAALTLAAGCGQGEPTANVDGHIAVTSAGAARDGDQLPLGKRVRFQGDVTKDPLFWEARS
jgi:hypothetical protein